MNPFDRTVYLSVNIKIVSLIQTVTSVSLEAKSYTNIQIDNLERTQGIDMVFLSEPKGNWIAN